MKTNMFFYTSATDRKIKYALCVLLFIFFSVLPSMAQEKIGVLKLSPQHFIASTMKINYEHSLSHRASINISPSMTAFDRDDEKVLGGGIELGRRFYLSDKDTLLLNGFYAHISIQYNYYDTWYKQASRYNRSYGYGYDSTVYTPYRENIHQIGGAFAFGYQVSVKNIFYVDMFFGGGLKMGISSRGNDSYYKSSVLDYAYNGIVPKAGLTLGIRI